MYNSGTMSFRQTGQMIYISEYTHPKGCLQSNSDIRRATHYLKSCCVHPRRRGFGTSVLNTAGNPSEILVVDLHTLAAKLLVSNRIGSAEIIDRILFVALFEDASSLRLFGLSSASKGCGVRIFLALALN